MIPRIKSEGVLFGKPVPTFPDHALISERNSSVVALTSFLQSACLQVRDLTTEVKLEARAVFRSEGGRCSDSRTRWFLAVPMICQGDFFVFIPLCKLVHVHRSGLAPD